MDTRKLKDTWAPRMSAEHSVADGLQLNVAVGLLQQRVRGGERDGGRERGVVGGDTHRYESEKQCWLRRLMPGHNFNHQLCFVHTCTHSLISLSYRC